MLRSRLKDFVTQRKAFCVTLSLKVYSGTPKLGAGEAEESDSRKGEIMCVERLLRFIAGFVVSTSLLLAWKVHIYWLGLTAFWGLITFSADSRTGAL